MKEYKRTVALERRVQAYPKPKYSKLLEDFTVKNAMSKSEALNHIIKDFFDKQPANATASKHHY